MCISPFNIQVFYLGHPATQVCPLTTAWREVPEWFLDRLAPNFTHLPPSHHLAPSPQPLQVSASTRRLSGTTLHKLAATCWESSRIEEIIRSIGERKKREHLLNLLNPIQLQVTEVEWIPNTKRLGVVLFTDKAQQTPWYSSQWWSEIRTPDW